MERNEPIPLLGLALRGGRLAVGEDAARDAVRAGQARLLMVSADAADRTVRFAEQLSREGNCLLLSLPCSKSELGGGLGRRAAAIAALTDAGLAAAVGRRLAALDPAAYGEASERLELKLRRAKERRESRENKNSPSDKTEPRKNRKDRPPGTAEQRKERQYGPPRKEKKGGRWGDSPSREEKRRGKQRDNPPRLYMGRRRAGDGLSRGRPEYSHSERQKLNKPEETGPDRKKRSRPGENRPDHWKQNGPGRTKRSDTRGQGRTAASRRKPASTENAPPAGGTEKSGRQTETPPFLRGEVPGEVERDAVSPDAIY